MMEFSDTECPCIIVNPKPTPFGFRGFEVPGEAFPDIRMDDPFVKDVDPQTWAVCGFTPKITSSSLVNSNELPIAERFRLAYVERDTFGTKTSKKCKATSAPCREGVDDGRYKCQGNSSGFKSYQISQHLEVEI
ncbi:hypothetical protein Dsin_023108 [Dipteronia sinensis]|uniref:Uncharacterized protein n=1 Tax=Dipteronia sinensis TaxID=43782 RepID=A0AAE0A2M9_9ROSI|nr:hypothetical protein Dsin_023108 [Dipteronia sinensis]